MRRGSLSSLVAVLLLFAPDPARSQPTLLFAHSDWIGDTEYLQVQPDGTTYVTSAQTSLLIRDPAGDLTGISQGPLSRFVVDPAGNAYVIFQGSSVSQVFPDGQDLGIAFLGGTNLADIDRAPDGTLYLADTANDEVLRLELSGVDTTLLDATGDGAGNTLADPRAVVVAPDETVYVAGAGSNNVFSVTTGGVVTEILDATGDGLGNTASQPWELALDGLGRLFVACNGSDNVFRIDPGGAITEVLDASGDGLGNTLNGPRSVDAAADGTAYVGGVQSDNVFEIAPGGAVTEIMDAAGAGAGSELEEPSALDLDAAGDLYVLSQANDRVLRWDGAAVTLHMDESGQPGGVVRSFRGPLAPAFGPGCAVYLAGEFSSNVFCVQDDGSAAELSGIAATVEIAVDAAGNLYAASDTSVSKRTSGGTVTTPLITTGIADIALDPVSGALYVAARDVDTVHRIDSSGSTSVWIDATGDGLGNTLDDPWRLLLEADGSLVVLGRLSDNVFRVSPGGAVTEILDATGDGVDPLDGPTAAARGSDGSVYVASADSFVFAVRPGGSVELAAPVLGGIYSVAVSPADTLFAASTNEMVRVKTGGPVESFAIRFPTPFGDAHPLFAFSDTRMWLHHEDPSPGIHPERISESDDEADTLTLLFEQPQLQLDDGFDHLATDEHGRLFVAGTIGNNAQRGLVWRVGAPLAPVVPLLPWGFYLACAALLAATRVRR